MEYSDVVTFFHEFGHLMHWILGGQQEWAGISGITMESDFVEAPSQMLEEWMRSPQVLAKFARHYKTGRGDAARAGGAHESRFGVRQGKLGRASRTRYTAISYDIYKGKPQDVDLDAVTHGKPEALQPHRPAAGHASLRVLRTSGAAIRRPTTRTCGTR